MGNNREGKGLTLKQKRFCEEYLIDGNASRSALAAGYSKKTAFRSGQENMQKPAIKAELGKYLQKQTKRTEITADKVLENLRRIGDKAEKAKRFGEAIKAEELIGKHFKMFVDRLEVDGSIGLYERRLAELE